MGAGNHGDRDGYRIGAFRGLGCSGRPGRVSYGITQQGQPLPGQVAAGGDVTCCRSGQAGPVADGTCARKGVADGAPLVRREARQPIRKSANGVWSALLRSNIRGVLGTRGGCDRASRLVVGCSALRLIVGCRRRIGNFRRLGKQPRVGL
ncbi:hypothetical protein TIFTF001_041592 [Ficus carica]|uniref:Uncharacterized protein n=1 Tax=Ficus carica TaxID=3494 RepID=A0AA87ZGN4_FICCA|nr:hypothetical protein TIFTF001_041592 [Ficus carica]